MMHEQARAAFEAKERERMVKSQLAIVGHGLVDVDNQFMYRNSSRNDIMMNPPKYKTKDERPSLSNYLGQRKRSPIPSIDHGFSTFGGQPDKQ